MTKLIKSRAKTPKPSKPLGKDAYRAIAAVEGLHMSKESADRLNALEKRNLSPDQRRAEVIRAYAGASSVK